VSHHVTHLVGQRKRQFRVVQGKFGVSLFDIVARFTDHFEIAKNGTLHQPAFKKRRFIQIFGVVVDSLDRFEDMG
jgi:hypothetical protein